MNVEERLYSKARRMPNGCLEWQNCKSKDGYGKFHYEGRTQKAHIVSFVLRNGWRPEAVLHKCDNPPCIDPDHLTGGTQAQNVSDMMAKRRWNGAGLKLGTEASRLKRMRDNNETN